VATVSWHRGNQSTGSILLSSHGDALTLTYRYRVHGGDWQDVTQSVALDWTPCRYGGVRPWFLCPRCSRRVAVLAMDGHWFWCRHCYRLPYTSQQEGRIDRLYRKARKIRDKVGASHNLMEHVWRKPKGMHWRTFERLCTQEREAHLQALHALLAMPL
jgi:hypothetical protein